MMTKERPIRTVAPLDLKPSTGLPDGIAAELRYAEAEQSVRIKDFARLISKKTDVDEKLIMLVIRNFVSEARFSLSNGRRIQLRGFGAFQCKNINAPKEHKLGKSKTPAVVFQPSEALIEDVCADIL